MLTLFILHIAISVICMVFGFLLYHGKQKDHPDIHYKSPIIYLITGLIGLTAITQLLALFLPIDIYIQSAIVLLICIALVFRRPAFKKFSQNIYAGIRKQSWQFFAATAVIWILLLSLNAGPTIMDDTDSYHIQMIKWIKELGSVPGLIHLHERYGFNSSWFSSVALFSFSKGHYNYYTVLNSVVSVWLTTYIVSLVTSTAPKYATVRLASLIVLALSLLSWPIIRGNASSANYDAAALLIIFVLFTESLVENRDNNGSSLNAEWLTWPAYLVTVRFMNFPMLLLSLAAFIFLLKRKQFKQIGLYVFLCLLLIVPFLIRNVILSGYIAYPALYPDLFQVDWKADKESTTALLHFIKYFNRVSTGFLPLETTAAMGFPEWISAWIKYMFLYHKLVFLPGLAGLLIYPFTMNKIGVLRPTPIKIFVLALLLQTLTWFFIAPDPRFIYGCLIVGCLLLSITLLSWLKMQPLNKWPSYLLIVLTIGLAIFTTRKMITESNLSLLTPSVLPTPELKTVSIDNIQLYIPEKVNNNWNARCYDTNLPCIYEFNPRLRLRGTSLKEGFKLAPKN